jgi:hypothetical protein
MSFPSVLSPTNREGAHLKSTRLLHRSVVPVLPRIRLVFIAIPLEARGDAYSNATRDHSRPNGRRYEDFEDAEINIEVYSSDETVEIVIEAANDLATSDRRPFALLDIPKHLFSSALGAAAQRKGTPGPRPA